MCSSPESKVTWPTWGPPESCRPQVGPMWAPWTLLSGWCYWLGSSVAKMNCNVLMACWEISCINYVPVHTCRQLSTITSLKLTQLSIYRLNELNFQRHPKLGAIINIKWQSMTTASGNITFLVLIFGSMWNSLPVVSNGHVLKNSAY